jgi:hypothetical protein
MAAEECIGLAPTLARQQGANGIDEEPAPSHKRRCKVEHSRLQRDAAVEPLGRKSPPPFRAPPPGPRSRTGGIDEDHVGTRMQIGKPVTLPRRVQQSDLN